MSTAIFNGIRNSPFVEYVFHVNMLQFQTESGIQKTHHHEHMLNDLHPTRTREEDTGTW